MDPGEGGSCSKSQSHSPKEAALLPSVTVGVVFSDVLHFLKLSTKDGGFELLIFHSLDLIPTVFNMIDVTDLQSK